MINLENIIQAALLYMVIGYGSPVVAAQTSMVPVVLENKHVRYSITAEGQNHGFIDLATGTDYLQANPPSSCASIQCDGKSFPATAAVLADGRLTLKFGDSGAVAIIGIEPQISCIRLTIESVSGRDIDALEFLKVPLKLKGNPSDAFGACAYSLNLITRVDQLPALQTSLNARCYKKFGIVGAKAAIVGMPMKQMLPALKEVLLAANEMPLCKVAGPWAQEIPFNHGSYLFNFGALVETNVDEWISMTQSLGFNQIDNHGGSSDFFRFGDFALNRKKWPEGWETYSRIVKRLHDAGIGSIFHTYAFFIDKQSKYVTPVPDPRLDAFRVFSLADSITADATEIRVNESTAGMTTITGFFEHNSVVLHIGDELTTFGGVSQEAPWRFTGVKRGAFGAKSSAHPKGARARHLKECFGLFVPNPESTLFEEIAANHAEIVNQCGFDGIYLDAIDGASILRGGDECWYWADKFVFEIQKRLAKPVGMEMSAMWHHFWQYRTRWQAWDYPQRGQKRFIDLHAQEINGGLLLPLHLGWWNFQSFNPPQVEPSYPDVIEYLGAKLIGWDAGISLTGGVDRKRLNSVPLFKRAVDILRSCEELRHSGAIPEDMKARLREPGAEFSLYTNSAGKLRFCRSRSDAHTAALAEPWSLSWQAVNPFARQPARLRIEALMSASNNEDPEATTIADPSELSSGAWQQKTASGVSIIPVEPATVSTGKVFTLVNSGKVPQNAAWARFEKRFTPPMSLKNRQALGFWVEGDGLGEIIAIRLESPRHIAFGAVADRYLTVDFTGRRFVTLIETESARWNDYAWNDGKGLYNLYRETIDFNSIESASVWWHNLPAGKTVQCAMGPIKALPMVPGIVKNPTITINGSTLIFPVVMRSGNWIEFNGLDACTLYGANGEMLEKVVPRGVLPEMSTGKNLIQFSCESDKSPLSRARIVIFTEGDEL